MGWSVPGISTDAASKRLASASRDMGTPRNCQLASLNCSQLVTLVIVVLGWAELELVAWR